MYASVPTSMADAESLRLANCIIQLDQWMSKNRLKLNADETQLIWLGTRQQLAKLTVTQLRLTSPVVEFDSTVTAHLRVQRSCSVEQSATNLVRKHVTGYI